MSQETPPPSVPQTPRPGEIPHPGHDPQVYGQYGLHTYGYQNYAYAGGDGHTVGNRTLRDYLMIVRERVWYLVLAIFVFTTAAMLYNQSVEPEYQAMARFKIYRNRVTATSSLGTTMDDTSRILDERDFNTQITAMKSTDIINRVIKRLTQDERNDVLTPYQAGNIFSGPLRPDDVVGKCVLIQPERQTFAATVSYRHPNKALAVKMANYFVEEIQRANDEETSQVSDPLVERLKIQTDQIQQDIQDLSKKRNDLVEQKKILTLTKGMSTAATELNQLASLKESDKRAYEEAKANRDQLLAAKAAGQSISTIPFIARDDAVQNMTKEVATLEIQLSGLLKRYTPLHPNVISAQRQLEQARVELDKSISQADAKLESTYRTVFANYENSTKRFADKETELNAQQEAYTQYETLDKEIRNKEEVYNKLLMTYETKKADRSGLSSTPIRLIEPANLTSDRPVNKNGFIALALGLLSGTVVGLGLVFFLASLDDRVKSAADIEQFVGLPLLGVIPKITKLDNFKRARTVSTNADRATTESFHAIYSALKIHDQARKAKAILTTSTTPSEGKSFFTTNLAETYAMHGEKVIVVDADLRLPNVGRSLQLEGDNGITKYQAGMITLDEAIRRDVVPNMDVLPVGAACKNPTQVLNSRKFAEMIEELKGRYDRVFIDSPPVGAVSDALNLMPQVDGAIYVVKFNTVKRKNIKGNLRRLKESKVPVFGAVLNQIGMHVANYYTATYDKAYNKYYHETDPNAVEVKVS